MRGSSASFPWTGRARFLASLGMTVMAWNDSGGQEWQAEGFAPVCYRFEARKYNTASPLNGGLNERLPSGTVIVPDDAVLFVEGFSHSYW